MTDALVTIEGRATADPELRHTEDGTPVANFNVAHTDRRRNAQTGEWEDVGETLFLRVSVWGDQGIYVAESVKKGTEVVVIGRLRQPAPYTVDGVEKKSAIEVRAKVVSIDLRRARAIVSRVIPSAAPDAAKAA